MSHFLCVSSFIFSVIPLSNVNFLFIKFLITSGMTTEQESNVEPKKEEKNDEFLIPKLPVKKPQQPVVAEQPKVKSAINKFNSLIPPSVESYVAPVSFLKVYSFILFVLVMGRNTRIKRSYY